MAKQIDEKAAFLRLARTHKDLTVLQVRDRFKAEHGVELPSYKAFKWARVARGTRGARKILPRPAVAAHLARATEKPSDIGVPDSMVHDIARRMLRLGVTTLLVTIADDGEIRHVAKQVLEQNGVTRLS